MSKCAYCSKEEKMTREHIIPKFLYDFQNSISKSYVGWNEIAEKMIKGEGKVKDVCAECNNEKLGTLDGAAKEMLENANLLVHNYTKKTIELRYDFDLLVRWLMKVSFNSTRVDSAHSYMFEPYIPYMIDGKNRVLRSNIAVMAYFSAPQAIDKSNYKGLPFSNIADESEIVNPFFVRICYGHVTGAENYKLRMVIIGAIVFFLLIFDDFTLPGHAASAIRKFIKNNPNAIEVTPKIKAVVLRPGSYTWLDLYQHQIARNKIINSIDV